MRATPELTYNPAQDERVFLGTHIVDLEGLPVSIDAGTDAGRRQPEDSPKPNEDTFSIVRRDHLLGAAVFDGASSQKPIPELGSTSGARYASHSLKELLEEGGDGELDSRAILVGLNRALGARFRTFASVDYTDLNSLPTSTGTIALFDPRTGQVKFSHVGDTFAVALFEDDSTALLTNNLHRQFETPVRALTLDIASSRGATPRQVRDDPRIRVAMMQMFQETRNKPDGTGEGIINGDPNMEQYIHTSSLPLAGLRAVLLGCDGLVPPGVDIAVDRGRQTLMEIARRTGIRGLVEHVRRIEDGDPERVQHLRFKHADDATGILVNFDLPRSTTDE